MVKQTDGVSFLGPHFLDQISKLFSCYLVTLNFKKDDSDITSTKESHKNIMNRNKLSKIPFLMRMWCFIRKPYTLHFALYTTHDGQRDFIWETLALCYSQDALYINLIIKKTCRSY